MIMWLLLWEAWGAMRRSEWTNCYFNRYFNSYVENRLRTVGAEAGSCKPATAFQLRFLSMEQAGTQGKTRGGGSCSVGSSLSLPTLGEITQSVVRLYRDSASASLTQTSRWRAVCSLPTHTACSDGKWDPYLKNWISQRVPGAWVEPWQTGEAAEKGSGASAQSFIGFVHKRR